ncbi:MAG TPA: NUDIX domain-containing protein [Alphaproteobacteria bacterium]|nr:NUDIX domain-containing protein [Alphaproteobacteria bacterium]
MSSKNNIHVLSRAVIIDQNHILVCKTRDLPISFYFLPGGHVEHGESAETAVLRELFEESGSQCTIKRFLGCLEYSFEPGHSSICHNHEVNFFFEADSDDLKIQNPIASREEHIELIWLPLREVGSIDFRPEPLKTLILQWLDSNVNNAFRSVMI